MSRTERKEAAFQRLSHDLVAHRDLNPNPVLIIDGVFYDLMNSLGDTLNEEVHPDCWMDKSWHILEKWMQYHPELQQADWEFICDNFENYWIW